MSGQSDNRQTVAAGGALGAAAAWGPLTAVGLLLAMLFGTSGSRAPSATPAGKAAGSSSASGSVVGGPMVGDFRRPYLEFRFALDVPDPSKTKAAPPAAAPSPLVAFGRFNVLVSAPLTVPSTPSTEKESPIEAARALGKILALDAEVGRIEPEFLVATVPDPIDTRFAYRFDAISDVLRQAAEARGWTLDRSWLPWNPSGRQIADRSDLKPPPDDVTGASHLRQPGLLLFRQPNSHGPAPQRVLLLWLVGESPTSGLSKEALTASLEVIWAYHAERDRLQVMGGVGRPGLILTRPRIVRLVAPVFSGTQESLQQTLAGWLHVDRAPGAPDWPLPWTVQIRSGSANRLDFARLKQVIETARRGTKVEADTTLIPFDTVMKRLLAFLKERNGGSSLGKVAILSEGDTAFGHVPDQNHQRRKGGAAKPGNTSEPAPTTDEKHPWLEDERTTITTMQFPFHISQMAVAFRQKDGDSTGHDGTLVRSSNRLTLPLTEAGQPREDVSLLSPATTTPINELVLTKLMESIANESFRYVGIVATDSRDAVFLIQRIRQYCPDVQVFLPGGDLVLAHPQFASDLRGTIVATSYPLFPMAQRWDPPHEGDHHRHLFSDESDQGIYNATVSLLASDGDEPPYFESMFDYGEPFDELSDLSRLWEGARQANGKIQVEGAASTPSLWLSVVGQRGLWPVRAEAQQASWPAQPLFTANSPPAELSIREFARRFAPLLPEFTWQWLLLSLALTALAWKLISLQTRVTHMVDHDHNDPSPLPLLRLLDSRLAAARQENVGLLPEAIHREVLVLVGLLVFTMAYGIVVIGPTWIAFRQTPWPQFLRPGLFDLLPQSSRWLVVAALAAFLVGLITLIGLFCALLRRARTWRGSTRLLVIVGLFLTATWLVTVPSLSVGILTALCGVLALAWVAVFRRWSVWSVGAAGVIATLFCVIGLPWIHRATWDNVSDRTVGLFTLERAIDFSSGVSPIIPIVALTIVTLLWVYSQLSRYEVAERFWVALEASQGDGYPSSVRAVVALCRSPRDAYRAFREFIVETRGTLLLQMRKRPRFRSAPPAGAAGHAASEPGPALREGGGESQGGRNNNEAIAAPLPPAEAVDAMHDRYHRYLPGRPQARRRVEELFELYRECVRLARVIVPRRHGENLLALLGGAFGLLLLTRLLLQAVPAVDFPGWAAWRVLIWVWFLWITILLTLLRFALLWRALSRLLNEFARLPMARAFDRLPPAFTRVFGRYLEREVSYAEMLLVPVQQWVRVVDLLGSPGVYDRVHEAYLDAPDRQDPDQVGPPSVERAFACSARTLVAHPDAATLVRENGEPIAPTPAPGGAEAIERIQCRFRQDLERARFGRNRLPDLTTWTALRDASRACFDLLDPFWQTKPAAIGYADRAEKPDQDDENEFPRVASTDKALRAWIRASEEFVALELITYAGQIGVQLKNLATYLAVAPILLLLTTSTYPFQPLRLLQIHLWGLVLIVAGVVVLVYVSMERDVILSRVAKTTPDSIAFDGQFLRSILTFILPVMTIILAQFPFFSDTLNQWLEPITRVLK